MMLWAFVASGLALIAQETLTYSYDALGRLTGSSQAAGSTTTSTTFTSDDAYNRTSRVTVVTAGALESWDAEAQDDAMASALSAAGLAVENSETAPLETPQ